MWITSMWPLKLFLYGIGSLIGHSTMVYHSAAYPLCTKSHLAFSVLLSLQLHKHRKPKDTVCERWTENCCFIGPSRLERREKDCSRVLAQDLIALQYCSYLLMSVIAFNSSLYIIRRICSLVLQSPLPSIGTEDRSSQLQVTLII